MLSPREALVAWQGGEITYRRAMLLTGAEGLLELYALLEIHGVETRTELLPRERRAVDAVMEAVARAERGP